jgi:diadenosine tetraphosphate (Ap4A) HIT family hydrolase/predicted house-cleaning noncanonical NTP pyrophosphatase (MazG superfamily)
MTLKYFKVEKLIRDKIPAILESKGVGVDARAMDDEEFFSKLKDKLLEETKEVLEATSPDELCEELADVLEVIHALSKASGLKMQQIEQTRLEKREDKGGFENRIFNDTINIEESSPTINYYLNRPHKYPEIYSKVHQPDCLFCQIARQEGEVKFFANFAHCYVIKDQFPVSNGHILIIPYEHTENWFTAKEDVRLDILKVLSLMKEQLDLDFSPHGYNIGANCGEVAGQSVMHLHMHLIPRYKGDMENPKGGVRGVIPSKQKY